MSGGVKRIEAKSEPRARAPLAKYVALTVFGAFIAYYGLLCFRHVGWGGDFQVYCAAVARLHVNLRNPLHEAMAVPGSQSTAYTVYLVAVAAVGRLLGASPYRTLEWAGLLNLLLFAGSTAFFFRRHSIHARWWLSAACFIFATLFLRWLHFGWSSETSLATFQYIQPYPSTVGWSLALFCFALMDDGTARVAAWRTIALGLLLAALLLTHVLTASWAIGILGLHALWLSTATRRWQPLARLTLALALALVLAAVWPYAPFFSQGSMVGTKEPSQFGGWPFHDFPNLYALGLPCFAYLIWRLRRHAFWLAGMLATLCVLLLFRQLGFTFGNRYAFFAAFFVQFAVAEVMPLGIFGLVGPLSELPVDRRWANLDRVACAALVGVVLVAWLPSPMFTQVRAQSGYGRLLSPAALLRLPSPEDEYYAQFASLQPFLARGDLVLTPITRSTFDLASVTGASVVLSPNALQVPDKVARQRDVARFFNRKSSAAERSAIVQRLTPTKLLLRKSDFALRGPLSAQFGPALYAGHDYALWQL
jgi:hypothetical protein